MLQNPPAVTRGSELTYWKRKRKIYIEDLGVLSVMHIPVRLGIVSGRSRIARARYKKTGFRRAGPNFGRPLLRAICFFCGV